MNYLEIYLQTFVLESRYNKQRQLKTNTTLTLDILISLKEYNIPIAESHISDLVAFTRSVLVGGVQSDKNAQKQLDKLTQEVITKFI